MTLLSIFIFTECSDNSDEIQTTYKTDVRTDRVISEYASSDPRHPKLAKALSIFFKRDIVRNAFDSYCRTKQNSVVLLSNYLFDAVLSNSILSNMFLNDLSLASDMSLHQVMNEYLFEYPTLEISFVQNTENDYPDIGQLQNFETVSVYSDITNFPIYVDGVEYGTYLVTDEPTEKTILKIQSSDVFYVWTNNNLNSSNSNNKISDLLTCGELRNYLNEIPYQEGPQKLIGGNVYNNPLSTAKFIEIMQIYNKFNEACGVPDGFPTEGDTELDPRNSCDRDALINRQEQIRDVRGLNGKTILRSCDTWCSYWDKNCTFQVDIYIPTVKDPNTFGVIGSLMKVFSLNEKRLRNGWFIDREIPITEWLYLEGKHGDEWLYNWTGRHRKRGTTSERTISLGLSSEIGFKILKQEVKLKADGSISNKITHANEDCPLGNDISRYCNPLEEQRSIGDIGFKLIEK